jgi:hypothetical protein
MNFKTMSLRGVAEATAWIKVRLSNYLGRSRTLATDFILSLVFIFSSGFAFCATAHPEMDTTPLALEGEPFLYTTDTANPRILVEAFEQGFPRLWSLAKPEAPPPPANSGSPISILSGQFKQALRENIRQMNQQRNESNVGIEPSVLSQNEDEPLLAPAAPRVAWDWKKFCDCANATLPALKMRLRYRFSQAEMDSGLLEGALSFEKGDGVFTGGRGLTCGAFIGPYGFAVATASPEIDEIKILRALGGETSARELEPLWRTFVLFGRAERGESLHVPAFWRFAWEKLVFRKVFASSPVPELSSMISQFKSYVQRTTLVGNTTLSFSLNENELARQINQDWAATETVGKEVTPCLK